MDIGQEKVGGREGRKGVKGDEEMADHGKEKRTRGAGKGRER